MDIELSTNCEELIQNLNDRIEELERTLNADEIFCNQDIDATYQLALKFLKKFERKFSEKLNELKIKLDHIREENLNISKQNKKQFDDEIEHINQLYISGKHQEALDKFYDCEKRFPQRRTIIENIPKLYLNDIDINQYFSIDKPIITPQISSNIKKQNSIDNIKPIKTEILKKENDHRNEPEPIKSYFDIRLRNSDNQQTPSNTNHTNKERKSPLITTTTSPRPFPFSTRLSSSSSKSLSITGNEDTSTPMLISNTKINSRENLINHTQIQTIASSPNIIPSPIQRQISTIKTSKGESLILTFITHYQFERNTSLLMTCNENSILILRNQSDRWYSTIIERLNPIKQYVKLHDLSIKSIGYIDINNIYIFTERKFLKYSSNLLTELSSCVLLIDKNYNFEYNDNQHVCFGIIYDKYIYYIYLNIKSHWILSILEYENKTYKYDHDLTEIFPDVKRFIDICINDRRINLLVQIDQRQYAVMFCSINIHFKIELNRKIQLSYAGNPLKICPIYIPYIKKLIFFINDPSVKIIHILNNEKYVKSYSLIVYTLCYVEKNHELILTTNDGVYSININEHQNFFSELH